MLPVTSIRDIVDGPLGEVRKRKLKENEVAIELLIIMTNSCSRGLALCSGRFTFWKPLHSLGMSKQLPSLDRSWSSLCLHQALQRLVFYVTYTDERWPTAPCPFSNSMNYTCLETRVLYCITPRRLASGYSCCWISQGQEVSSERETKTCLVRATGVAECETPLVWSFLYCLWTWPWDLMWRCSKCDRTKAWQALVDRGLTSDVSLRDTKPS